MSRHCAFASLCQASDVSEGQAIKVVRNGKDLAVFHIEGQYYVTDDLCTHGPGSLSEGLIEGHEVECDFHEGRFDVRTGEPTVPPCMVPLKTYKTKVEDGFVMIEDEA